MRILIVSILAFLFVNPALAQPSKLRFTKLSVEDGLSQNTVKCILKDSRGFMWFGTRDGLNRYDGYRFTTFRRDQENKESLSSNFITDLLEDKEGNFWVGTSNGLCKWDPQKETFKRYFIDSTAQFISDIMQDRQGRLWIGTNSGLYQFDAKEGTFTSTSNIPAGSNSFPEDRINKVMEDNYGTIWIAHSNGLISFAPETNSFFDYRHEPKDVKSIGRGNIASVFADSRNRIWIATSEEGVSLFNPQDSSFTRYSYQPELENSISYNDVLCFTEDREGRIWIGTQNGGMSTFDPVKKQFKNFTYDINDPTSLGGISIHSLYTDDIGNVWVGTWAGGVSMWSTFNEKFAHYGRFAGLNSTNVYAIKGDENDPIWIGVEGGGLVSLDPQSQRFSHHPNANEPHITTNVILTIDNLNRDSLLIGYQLGGFAFFNKRSGVFSHFMPDESEIKRGLGTIKTSVRGSGSNHYWIGDGGGGISLYNKKDGGFIHFPPDRSDPHSLNDGMILTIFVDSRGNTWVGTFDGLHLYESEKMHFKRFLHDETDKKSISNNYILSIFEDSKGRLWFGTGGGLNLFDGSTQTFTSFTTKDGLPNENIKSILEDDKNNLWLATNLGISRFNVEAKTFRNFDTSDGLQGNEFNRNAAYKAPDGTMYFGGTRGINVFHPDSIVENPYIPPVVLTEFRIFNEVVGIGTEDSILQKAIGFTSEITLSHNHSLSIGYSALNYTSPSKNKYAYKLEGYDKEWNYVENKQLATYTNLDPGKYIFKVIASNNDGIWNMQGTDLKIRIMPPFYLQWWFKVAATLFVLGLIFLVYQYRSMSIRKQNLRLSKLVDDRTEQLLAKQEEINTQNEELLASNFELSRSQEEIAAQRDILVQQNKQLSEARNIIESHNENLDKEVKERTRELVDYNQQLEQFAFIAAHNLRAPVARILGLGQLAKLNDITLEDEKMILRKMGQTAEELDQVVRDINTILEIRKNNTLSISEVDLEEELKIIKANLSREINETQADIWHNFTAVSKLQTVKPYLDSIILNLLSNAIKYRHPQRPPQIHLKTYLVDNCICLEVRDNGLGIDLDAHGKNVFTLYKRFHSHVEGKGMGLYLVKTQAEALGATIEVQSKVNEGSTFKIFIHNKPEEKKVKN